MAREMVRDGTQGEINDIIINAIVTNIRIQLILVINSTSWHL